MLIGFAVVIGGFVLLLRSGGVGLGSSRSPDQTVTAEASAAQGGLVVPVAGVQVTQLTDTWGQSRAGGERAHEAIDIAAPQGTPVLAAAAGTIEKIFDSKDGGHTLYVRRDDVNWQDYYAHLDAYAPNLREGMKVAQGQPLGTVGATGDASPDAPHLHYAVNAMAGGDTWSQGRAVNPYPILAGQAASR